jgi:hypothetical protein
MTTAAIYVRVSTTHKSNRGDSATFDQNPEVQAEPLRGLVSLGSADGNSIASTPIA